MKSCRLCGSIKALGDFYVIKGNFDGRDSACKECVKARVRAHRAANIDQIREYDRERGLLPHRKESVRKTYAKRVSDPEKRQIAWDLKKKWVNNNRVKRAAHIIVGNAIRDGKLTPQPCEKCGGMDKIHAHHEDYNYPLSVNWLCQSCHGQRHREINQERRNANKLQNKEG